VARVVVDASAAAALVFGEPQAETMAARLDGHALAAPSLLPYEIANVAAVKLRSRRAEREAIAIGIEVFLRLRIELHEPDVRLARALGAEIVTLDRRLAAAARSRA
jgi:predicted nucleic acid-binding protein